MTEPADDHSLVQSCREGNAEAFGVLVRRYQDRLYPALFRLLGSEDDARDVLQDSFVRAYIKLDQFHGSSSFYTWIYRIAINLAVSHHRQRSPRAAGTAGSSLRPAPLPEIGDPRRDSDPGAELERVERQAQIQQALSNLSPEHRAVVILKDLEEHRYEEISDILEIPIGTVRSRLHRARSELRQRLSGLFADEFSAQKTRSL